MPLRLERSGPTSNRPTWFLGPTGVHYPKGISIGSAVFARLTSVTDRSTDHATRSVTTEHIYVRSTAMRPNSNNNTYLYSDLKPLNTQALACVMHMHLVSWTHNNCNGGLNIVNRSPIEINSKTNTANVFLYPSFGVGCSEVEIDCLTGDHTVTF